MKKLNALILLAALAGIISFHAYANTPAPVGFGMGDFGFNYGFGGFNYGFGSNMVYAGFNRGMDFGGFGYGFGMDFGGFGHGFGMDFGGFGSGFTVHHADHALNRKIVPLPADMSVTTASVILDESGEIRIRPFDDEDLFVED